MEGERVIVFHPFRLDCINEQLWRGEQRIPLRPKPFAILHYLAEHADTLVTKAALRAAVWGTTKVTEGVLKGYLRDLRQVLGDDAAAPRFIETVARRGYRFIAPLTTAPLAHRSRVQVQGSKTVPIPGPQRSTPGFVGREAELTQLQSWLAQALGGERRLIFVTGESGIGKT